MLIIKGGYPLIFKRVIKHLEKNGYELIEEDYKKKWGYGRLRRFDNEELWIPFFHCGYLTIYAVKDEKITYIHREEFKPNFYKIGVIRRHIDLFLKTKNLKELSELENEGRNY